MSHARLISKERAFILAALFAGAVAGSAWFLEAGGNFDPLGRRLKISLLRYAGTEDAEARSSFSIFRGFLKDNIWVLTEELIGAHPEFAYLGSLGLNPTDRDGIEDRYSTESSLQSYWSTSRSLILLRGTIVRDPDKTYSAQSRLFFGDLKGTLPHPSISVDLLLIKDTLSNRNDVHTLAIYYALAMDADRTGDEPALVITLLNRAKDKVQNIKKRVGARPDTTELQQAIERAIAAQKSRVSRP